MSDIDPHPLSSAELAAFVAAMECGSVQGAADALELTQSAVTKRLQALERRVGLQLMERGRFGARATEAGRLLYPEARQALAALAGARAVLGDLRADTAHGLSLAASHTIGEFLLPGWLAAFRQANPQVRPQVDIVNSPGVLAAVREGRVDVGFVEGLDPLDDLDTLVVAHDEIVVVVAAGHRWTRRVHLPARELAEEHYLTREIGSGTRAVATSALERAGLALVPALEVASAQSLKRALGGGGFALMSRLAVDAEVRSGALHALAVPELGLERDLVAVRRSRGPRRAAASGLWRWLAGVVVSAPRAAASGSCRARRAPR